MRPTDSRQRYRTAILGWGLALCLLGAAPFAYSFQLYLDNFNTTYGTQGSRLDSCGVCHYNFNGGGPRNPYGEDFRNNNFDAANIGTLDSDGDGVTNDAEAAVNMLTHPGLTCSDLATVLNAPLDLADYVDPGNIGCFSSGQSPVANINGPYVAISGQPLQFSSAGSSDPDGTIVSYMWNLGLGNTSTEANPILTYTLGFNARILISLTVTDNDGNSTTDSTFVSLLQTPNSAPVADAGAPVSGVANQMVQFNGLGSSDPEGSVLAYSWNFGDNSSGAGSLPSHSYARCGTYNVTLTVTDDVGLTGSASTTATIASTGVTPPIANAGGDANNHYDATVGGNLQFDATLSADPDCDIVSYSWDFGDNSNGLGSTPVHSYSSAGDYVVSLTVTDNDGLTDTTTATVTVIDTGPLNGMALYDTHCGACHGFGANSTKAGAGLTRINSGIATVPAMNFLATTLSAAELQAIADYLTSLTAPPAPVTGQELYDVNCGSCHGFSPDSTKNGADITRINNGIANVPVMASLATTLTPAELQSIADYLTSQTPPTGGNDGASIWTNSCAACHGDPSSKAGATVSRINAGIANDAVTGMGFLANTLSANDIQLVADYLATIAPPTTPSGLYAAYCASCHGVDGSGGISNENVIGASANSISSAIVEEPEMQSLSFLTSTELQLISDFLNGDTTPPGGGGGTLDGQALYDTNCGGCHGLSPNSTKNGADITRINDGIATVPAMNSLNQILTAAELQAIADYLTSLAPPPAPTTGQGLYDSFCAACHGAGDNSNKAGATATRIQNGISAVPEMNSLANLLNSTDIQLIADYLATIAPPTTPQGLYQTYCASCHGADARGGTSGENVIGDSARSIRSAIREEREMRYLNFLTYEELQSISQYLRSLEGSSGSREYRRRGD